MRLIGSICAILLLTATSVSAQTLSAAQIQQALAGSQASSNTTVAGAAAGQANQGPSSLSGSGSLLTPQLTAPSGPTFGAAPALPQASPAIVVGSASTAGRQVSMFITAADGVAMPVYGTELFTGAYAGTRPGDRQDYSIQVGDVVAINLYGAVNTGSNQPVDANGNVFLPGVGPIHLAGVKASDLQSVIQRSMSNVFTNSVGVYAQVAQAGSIGVYIAGNVPRPGRYLGGARDNVLFFLSQAGGIDPARGSFRNIQVRRDGQVIATYDLYDFLLKGEVPPMLFADSDVILVQPRGAMVGVTGMARNAFAFETPAGADSMTGAELLPFARVEPTVSNAALSGFRNGEPRSAYFSLLDFERVVLRDGDHVDFRSDAFNNSVAVSISGEVKGPSVYVMPRGAMLKELLEKIPLEGTDIDVKYVHVRRASVAIEQKRAIDDALYNLQKQVLTTAPSTTEAAALATAQSTLINQFVAAAKQVQPDGNIAVFNEGKLQDLRLENGDIVVLPNHTDVIIVAGEVINPGGMAYTKGMRLNDYIDRAGGFAAHANKSKFVLRHLDGSGGVARGDDRPVPGDEIVVLPKVGSGYFQLAKDISTLLFQLAITSSSIKNIVQ